MSVCRGAHLTCLGGYFLCMLECIGSFCTIGVRTCMGMAACLVSIGCFLLMLDHVSYTLQKLWLSFQTSHQMIIQSETAR